MELLQRGNVSRCRRLRRTITASEFIRLHRSVHISTRRPNELQGNHKPYTYTEKSCPRHRRYFRPANNLISPLEAIKINRLWRIWLRPPQHITQGACGGHRTGDASQPRHLCAEGFQPGPKQGIARRFPQDAVEYLELLAMTHPVAAALCFCHRLCGGVRVDDAHF